MGREGAVEWGLLFIVAQKLVIVKTAQLKEDGTLILRLEEEEALMCILSYGKYTQDTDFTRQPTGES